MKKRVISVAISLAALAFAAAAGADDRLARFEGGIGVVPVRAGNLPTTVRGVNPGGQPWVIERLSADIRADGRISVSGRGLLLGGGDNVGFTGGNSVIATLICEPVAPFTLRNTGAVPLEPDGDFRIEDVLNPAPTAGCASPVLLIRSAGNGNWFAAGIPKLSR